MKRRESSRERGRRRLSARSDQGTPGWFLWQNAHHALEANMNAPCQLLLASSRARSPYGECAVQRSQGFTQVGVPWSSSTMEMTPLFSTAVFNMYHYGQAASGVPLSSEEKAGRQVCVRLTWIFLMVLGKAKCWTLGYWCAAWLGRGGKKGKKRKKSISSEDTFNEATGVQGDKLEIQLRVSGLKEKSRSLMKNARGEKCFFVKRSASHW